MSEQSNEYLRLATEAYGAQNFSSALENLEHALRADSSNVSAWILKGIVLAQTQRPSEATLAFEQAISAGPDNAKAYYNFATHMHQQGNSSRALDLAKMAVSLDPAMTSAQDLVRILEPGPNVPPAGVGGIPASSTGSPYASPPSFAQYPREGYQPAGAHTVPFVEKLGPKWVVIGYAISVVALLFFVFWLAVAWPYIQEIFANFQDQAKVQAASEKVAAKTGGVAGQLITYMLPIAAVAWMIIDLIDRRGNFLWLIPGICCACCGMHWAILPLYIVLARKD
jgi:tetratricopeptide (TPR) repeat protein